MKRPDFEESDDVIPFSEKLFYLAHNLENMAWGKDGKRRHCHVTIYLEDNKDGATISLMAGVKGGKVSALFKPHEWERKDMRIEEYIDATMSKKGENPFHDFIEKIKEKYND